MSTPEATLPPTTAATSQSPKARPNPVVPPLPRPSLDDVKSTAPDDRMRLLVRWLPEATTEEIAALAEAWFATMADSGTPRMAGAVRSLGRARPSRRHGIRQTIHRAVFKTLGTRERDGWIIDHTAACRVSHLGQGGSRGRIGGSGVRRPEVSPAIGDGTERDGWLIDELPPGLTRAQLEARYAAGLAENDKEAALRYAMQNIHGTACL